MFEHLTRLENIPTLCAYLKPNEVDLFMAFRNLLLALGKETFDFWWEDAEEETFEIRIVEFHKAMRQNDFFGMVDYRKANGNLDMALWHLCAASPIPFQIMHRVYLEETYQPQK